MDRIAKTAVKGAFGAMLLGALGLGATQALASPATTGDMTSCVTICSEFCGEGTGWNGWRCIGGDCVCW